MEKEDQNEKQDNSEYVDSRTVKTIRSLRKHSAKKSAQSSKNVKPPTGVSQDSQKDFKIGKKKSNNNRSKVQATMNATNPSEIDTINRDSTQAQSIGKKIASRKHTVIKSKLSKSGLNDVQKPNSRPAQLHTSDGTKVNTLISATLKNKNNDQTYITQDDNMSFSISNGAPELTRGDSKNGQSREKNGTAKRLPPGVRLYNQAKNPKNKVVGKQKDDAPPKPVLTKNVEEMLIQSNREKCEEIIKSSNIIHETLSGAGIDKTSMVEALFADPLFKHVLANLLFHAKILGKNKLETFLQARIKTFIKEYETDKQIKENLNNIHSKIQERIEKLKQFKKKYHDDFDHK